MLLHGFSVVFISKNRSVCCDMTLTHTHTQLFYGPFSWTTWVSRCQKRTLWCKGRLTEADTPTIRLGATPSGVTSAHLHHPPWHDIEICGNDHSCVKLTAECCHANSPVNMLLCDVKELSVVCVLMTMHSCWTYCWSTHPPTCCLLSSPAGHTSAVNYCHCGAQGTRRNYSIDIPRRISAS